MRGFIFVAVLGVVVFLCFVGALEESHEGKHHFTTSVDFKTGPVDCVPTIKVRGGSYTSNGDIISFNPMVCAQFADILVDSLDALPEGAHDIHTRQVDEWR